MSTLPQSKATARPTTTSASNRSSTNNTPMGDFHNPYNFVPALPRNTKSVKNSELGDRTPIGHGSYQDGCWSGKISVSLTTVTPLLIPDAANATGSDHKTYPIRLGLDGKPYLPPTSVKGMLRSAYEAVTNSRLSIFSEKHKNRLFYRMGAGDGLSLVPARIEGDRVKLLFGTTSDIPTWNPATQRWQIPGNLMYAAWLPRYRANNNLQYPNMKHGDRVKVRLELCQKQRKDKKGNTKVIFSYWLIREIVPFDQELSSDVPAGQIKTNGYVCITNKNIKNKHDERVFFTHGNPTNHSESWVKFIDDWEYLIKNYQEIHQNEPREEECEWSRHVLGGEQERKLADGTLCYAYVKKNAEGGYEIQHLYPVMISRAIFDLPPDIILSPEINEQEKDLRKLKPAVKREDLSPADRVFGWVNQNGQGSHKGQLRINSVMCNSDKCIKRFDKEPFKEGLPLAILGEPKPQQSRFYVANNCHGEPLQDGTKKAESYQERQGLRGRKVYPHHQLPSDYWETNSGTVEVGDRYREYLHPEKKQSNQNRTIEAWVKPETQFSFDIEVINLSSVELGALLWLLSLPEDCYHRLGGGKPLGFGSVKFQIAGTDLRTGEQWREFYSSLMLVGKTDRLEDGEIIKAFRTAVKSAYGQTFEQVSFIAAFQQSAKGFNDDKPIHYPRTKDQTPSGESFKWFVENEKLPRPHTLDSLVGDRGLPILKPKQKN